MNHKDLEDKSPGYFFFEVFMVFVVFAVFAVQLSLPTLCEVVKSITTTYRGLWSQSNSPLAGFLTPVGPGRRTGPGI